MLVRVEDEEEEDENEEEDKEEEDEEEEDEEEEDEEEDVCCSAKDCWNLLNRSSTCEHCEQSINASGV